MLGLKRGIVELMDHQEEWEEEAQKTVDDLWEVLSGVAVDIQHIGSTSIKRIHAKPIVDLVVGLNDLDEILPYIEELKKKEIIYRGSDHPSQLLFVKGDFEKDTRSHHIHVVIYDKNEWNNYINFRDYLNTHLERALEYDRLKLKLVHQYQNDRNKYTDGKKELMNQLLEEAKQWRKQSI